MPLSCAWRGLCALLGLSLLTTLASAAEPPGAATIGDFLAAGEFGPAQSAARQLPSGPSRDRWLRDIAVAQARAGAKRGAIDTLASMSDDQYRAEAVGQLRGPQGAMGGAAAADFDSLIDLIESTVYPNTWSSGTGEGSIEPFPTGVFVDAAGLLSKRKLAEGTPALDERFAPLPTVKPAMPT
jgi:hypothetical protein